MKYNHFKKMVSGLFSLYGFISNNNHYYLNQDNDVIVVFGIQKSNYGDYCYIEFGYCFKSINSHLPYPKYNQLNLNCGRIMTENGSRIDYSMFEDNKLSLSLIEAISNQIIFTQTVSLKGKEALKKVYFETNSAPFAYILGTETAHYFGLEPDFFKYHICFDK